MSLEIEAAQLAVVAKAERRVLGVAKHAALAAIGKSEGTRRGAAFGGSFGHRILLKS